MKICFKCNTKKPLVDFYKHSQMADGHLNKCKECNKKDSHKRFTEKLLDPEWAIKERKRQRIKEDKRRKLGLTKKYKLKSDTRRPANFALSNAIRDGKIKRKNCEICGNEKTQGHHEDYDKHLDVVWLCVRHHNDRHIHLRDCKTLKREPLDIKDFIKILKNQIT